jgi:hypothetical protein
MPTGRYDTLSRLKVSKLIFPVNPAKRLYLYVGTEAAAVGTMLQKQAGV